MPEFGLGGVADEDRHPLVTTDHDLLLMQFPQEMLADEERHPLVTTFFTQENPLFASLNKAVDSWPMRTDIPS